MKGYFIANCEGKDFDAFGFETGKREKANMKLSQARAEPVVQALVQGHGIAAARLRAQGAGPIAPVGTNGTEEGRARNRRVELSSSRRTIPCASC